MILGCNVTNLLTHMRLDDLLKRQMQEKQSMPRMATREEIGCKVPLLTSPCPPIFNLFFNIYHMHFLKSLRPVFDNLK